MYQWTNNSINLFSGLEVEMLAVKSPYPYITALIQWAFWNHGITHSLHYMLYVQTALVRIARQCNGFRYRSTWKLSINTKLYIGCSDFIATATASRSFFQKLNLLCTIKSMDIIYLVRCIWFGCFGISFNLIHADVPCNIGFYYCFAFKIGFGSFIKFWNKPLRAVLFVFDKLFVLC